jgi:hypothetical protein
MARRITFEYFDDLDGTRIEAGSTGAFGLDSRTYEIDLSVANRALLRKTLTPFLSGARRDSRGSTRSGSRARGGRAQ